MTWSPSAPRKVTTCTPLDSRGPKRLWDAPAGWVTRSREPAGGSRPLEFCCPVHGQFTVEVLRGEDPDSWPCPAVTLIGTARDFGTVAPRRAPCDLTSPWSPTTFGIWASSGEVTE